MKRYFVGLWAVASLGFTSYPLRAWADIDAPVVDKTKKAPAAAPLSDAQILTFVYLENAREIKADKLAPLNSASEDIKGIADDFRKDHVYIAKEVRALAGRLGVKLQDGPDTNAIDHKKASAQRDQIKRLKLLTGPAFDGAYKKMMAKSHESIINFMEEQRILLPKDSPVYDMLGTLIPKVRDHYDIISSTKTAL